MNSNQLPLPVQRGIKQERKILDKLEMWFPRFTEDEIFAFQVPESGRKASLDRHFIGDLVISVGEKTVFIDCTSVYERSDAPNKFRIRTSNKNLRFMLEYCERINRARQNFLEAVENSEDEAQKRQIFETRISSTCEYLDEILNVKKGPWWNSKEFKPFLAYEWANKVCIVPIGDFTLSQVLEKSDPSIFKVVKFSYIPATYCAHVLYNSYYGIGELFIDDYELLGKLIEITKKMQKNNQKYSSSIMSPIEKWAEKQFNNGRLYLFHE